MKKFLCLALIFLILFFCIGCGCLFDGDLEPGKKTHQKSVDPIPEPSSLLLLASAVATVSVYFFFTRRKKS